MRNSIVFLVLVMACVVLRPAEPISPVPPEAGTDRLSLPPGASPGWWSQVQENLRAEEYAVAPAGREAPGTYRAVNRAQGFATTFDGRGLRLEPVRRDEKAPTWSWGLELINRTADGGRPTADGPGKTAPAHVDGNRIEFDRGWVTEWYVNSPEGLEQGFTLPAPPLTSGVRGQESGVNTPDTSHLTPHGTASGVRSQESGVNTPDTSRLTPHGTASGVRGQESGVETGHSPLTTRHWVFLDLALSGTLHPRFSEDGQAVDFYAADSNIAVLRYGHLKVTDATGRVLPSRFEGFAQGAVDGGRPTADGRHVGGGLRIVVDDTGALYPITVDPLATTPSSTLWGIACDGNFGNAVATAGDVNGDGFSDVIVGSSLYTARCMTPGEEENLGAARLYLGSAAGLSETSAWWVVGPSVNSYMGQAVATAGDVNGDGYSDILVGVPGAVGQGYVYLYFGGQSIPSDTPDWSAVASELDSFGLGAVVATAGDVNGDGYSDILIPAPGTDGDTGRVHMFLGGPLGPVLHFPSWTVDGENVGDQFGSWAASAGDANGDGYADVVVGAQGFGGGLGKAYLYLGGPSGLATAAAWTYVGSTAGGQLGSCVMTAGDMDGDGYCDVVVGASGEGANAGGVYLFRGGSGGVEATPSWTASGEAAGDGFGTSLSPAGDINGDGFADIVIGAYGYSASTGRAHLYLGGPAGLSSAPDWTYTGGSTTDRVGCAVMTAGDVNGDGFSDVAVGADSFSTGSSVFVFSGSASGPKATASWTASGEGASNYFGWSLASAGDVNGDGYSDAVVGAYFQNSATGKAYLYLGGATGLSTIAAWTATGEAVSNFYGISVAGAGDANGDGYGDVLVGARGHTSNTGKVYLYLGSPAGLAPSSAWTSTGESEGSYFGNSVASAGDVNGDGYSDVVVGAHGYGSYQGRAYLYLGGNGGPSTSAAWTATGEVVSDHFAFCASTAGDVNRDGFSDVVVGAYGYNADMGKAYLYLGGASGLSPAASWSPSGAAIEYRFGSSVATAGDVNGDGYSDVVVGASFYNARDGSAYLYLGGATGLSPSASWSAVGEASSLFGNAVAGAGDVNGDGYSDILIGAQGYSSSTGRAYLYLGSAAGLSATAAWMATGAAVSARFGLAVGAADVNGDGYSDLLVGAPYENAGTGSASLYYGNGGAGTSLKPRQMRADLSAPIAPGGNAYGQEFRIGLRLRSSYGRVWAKSEWQAAPLSGSFDRILNPPQSASLWWDTGITGVTLTAAPAISELEGPWIWRMRARYSPAKSPFQGHGPWFTPCANGPRETDLRSVAAAAPPPCLLPDEPCWLYSVVKVGTDYTLNFQDPNQVDQRTGWNIRRSNDPSVLPKSSWPLVGSNVVDMDAGADNYQWTDHSGDDPGPGGVWYYQVTTYNANCPAEGPF